MKRPPLVVAGWPGADWPRLHPLLDAGGLPALAGLVEAGVSGPLATVEPLSVAPLWTALATGRPATVHGVAHDAEIDPTTGEVRPATAGSWRVPALWQTFADAGRRCHVLGWPATHPGPALPNGGVLASDSYARPTAAPGAAGVAGWPLLPGAVVADDPEIVAALAELRVSPAEIDAALLAEFVPRWREVDTVLDPRPRRLAMALAETWSLHNAATLLLEVAPPDALFVYYPLLERLVALFLPCAAGAGGEKAAGGSGSVSARHAEWFGGVLPAACRWLDACLGRLQTLAGPRATTAVVSPGGYRAPGGSGLPLLAETFPPTADLPGWRRREGMFALAGEEAGVRRDALAHRVNVLDVAPILARLAGLAGLARRVGEEIFMVPDAGCRAAGPVAREDAATATGTVALQDGGDLRAQWLATGEWPDSPAPERVRREANLALARAWMAQIDGAAFARNILEPMHADGPEDPDVAFALVECLLRLGSLPAARAAAETVFDHRWGSASAEFLRGHFACCERHYDDALAHFQTAGALAGDTLAGWENQLGLALLKLGRFAEADAAYGRSLARCDDDADAYLGRGHARLRLGDYTGAVEASRAAIARRYDYPLAHFNLGVALARTGENAEATHVLETVLHLLDAPVAVGRGERAGSLVVHTRRVLAVLRRRPSAPTLAADGLASDEAPGSSRNPSGLSLLKIGGEEPG